MNKKMIKHPVPEKHLKSIGDVIVYFALLENQLQSLIGSMLNERQRIGQIVTAELSFKNLRALLISLYIERHGNNDSDFHKLKDLLNRAGKIEEKRNQIIHSVWGAGKDSDSITRIKTTAKEKHGIRFQFENITSNYLEKFVTEIRVLINEVTQFWIYLIGNDKAINDYTIDKLS